MMWMILDDPSVLAGETFTSRRLLGTGGLSSLDALERAYPRRGKPRSGPLPCCGCPPPSDPVSPSTAGFLAPLDVLDRTVVRVLPNTAGLPTAAEAFTTPPHLAREAFGTS